MLLYNLSGKISSQIWIYLFWTYMEFTLSVTRSEVDRKPVTYSGVVEFDICEGKKIHPHYLNHSDWFDIPPPSAPLTPSGWPSRTTGGSSSTECWPWRRHPRDRGDRSRRPGRGRGSRSLQLVNTYECHLKSIYSILRYPDPLQSSLPKKPVIWKNSDGTVTQTRGRIIAKKKQVPRIKVAIAESTVTAPVRILHAS